MPDVLKTGISETLSTIRRELPAKGLRCGLYYLRPKDPLPDRDAATWHRVYYYAVWSICDFMTEHLANENVRAYARIHDVDDSLDKLLMDIVVEKPHLIGFSCYVWNVEKTLQLCERIKQVLPDSLIALGGPEVEEARSVLERSPFIDVVALGEGEESFESLAMCVLRRVGEDLGRIPGLSYREGAQIVSNPGRGTIGDLGRLPSPINSKYFKSHLAEEVGYECSRGCVFRCKYCLWGRKKRFFDLGRVETEVAALLSSTKVKKLFLLDAGVDEPPSYYKDVFRIIRRHNARRVEVAVYLSLRRADEDLFKLAKEANVVHIDLGIQTTSPEANSLSGRRWWDSGKADEILTVLKKYFRPEQMGPQVICGLPGDGYPGYVETLRWCYRHGLTQIQPFRLQVLPGTDFYREPGRFGLDFEAAAPHFVKTARGFPPADLLRASWVMTNMRVLRELLTPEDLAFINSIDMDLVGIAEEIHLKHPGWRKHVLWKEGDGEGYVGIAHRSRYPLACVLLDFLKKHRAGDGVSVLGDLVKYRVLGFLGELIARRPGTSGDGRVAYFLVTRFCRDIGKILRRSRDSRSGAEPSRAFYLFLVIGKSSTPRFFRTGNPAIFEKLPIPENRFRDRQISLVLPSGEVTPANSDALADLSGKEIRYVDLAREMSSWGGAGSPLQAWGKDRTS